MSVLTSNQMVGVGGGLTSFQALQEGNPQTYDIETRPKQMRFTVAGGTEGRCCRCWCGAVCHLAAIATSDSVRPWRREGGTESCRTPWTSHLEGTRGQKGETVEFNHHFDKKWHLSDAGWWSSSSTVGHSRASYWDYGINLHVFPVDLCSTQDGS